MSESLGPRKKDWDFSSTLKTLLDRHTLELSNEELEEINLYLLNQREHAIALYSQQLYGMKRTANRLSKRVRLLLSSVRFTLWSVHWVICRKEQIHYFLKCNVLSRNPRSR